MLYEINYLILQSHTPELEKMREEMRKFIESNGGKVVEEKKYLKRKLAYEIKHEKYGFYTVLRFESKSAKSMAEIKSKLNQMSNIARYLIVRADELPSLKEQEEKEKESAQQAEEEKSTVRQEDLDKVIKSKKQETTEKSQQSSAIENQAEEKKESDKKEVKTEKEVEKPSGKETEKEEEAEEKPEKEEDSEKKTGKDKVSLDELDKKLDEILNS
ncbi:MAG: 30S ribosomal protein S6 [Candidatus Moranbacteria bacterium]|nr:30S ribosomal protein S6 [Candidatus Moranbacteria bacterium]